MWARKTSGLSIEEAAKKLGIKLDRLESWESGDLLPTVTQLDSVANIYKRPVAIFFLVEPPEDSRPPKDFRRLPDNRDGNLTPRLRYEIRRCQLRQDTAVSLLGTQSSRITRLLGNATLSSNLEELAAKVRRVLDVSFIEQTSWRSPDVALRKWTNAFEQAGILIFQASRVEVAEMRGLSLQHKNVPAILINGADWPNGRIFTLLHEMAHLLLGAEGICDLYDWDRGKSMIDRTEQFCNRFAAIFLVPTSELNAHDITQQHTDGEWSTDELVKLGRSFSVSTEVILRRLVTIRRADMNEYLERRKGFLRETHNYRMKLKKSKGGPPIKWRILASNGRWFTRIVLSAYRVEEITGTEVSELLGAKLGHLRDIEGLLA